MTTRTRVARSPLTAEQQDLASQYVPLGRLLAKPFKSRWPNHRDDFESAAMLALVEAAEAFDPGRGVKFATFARHRVWGALRDVQRSLVALGWRCDPKAAPVVVAMPRDPEGKGRVVGAGLDSPIGREMEGIEAVEAWLRKVPINHARVLRRIYIHGENQAEAARAIGITRSRVSHVCQEAMSMLNGTWDARHVGMAAR